MIDKDKVVELSRELVPALYEAGNNVFGLPCFCISPLLHSRECAAVRSLLQKLEFALIDREE